MPVTSPRRCTIADTLELVGDRWSLLVLREVLLGVHRFADIAANTGAPRDVLTKRLRSLEAADVLQRRPYQQRPERFEYHPTQAGRELESILVGLREWGNRHLAGPPVPPRSPHSCEHEVLTAVVCAHCGTLLPTLIAGEHAPGRGDPR
jgi:DNA-binding HxlR family transcriptional regulator